MLSDSQEYVGKEDVLLPSTIFGNSLKILFGSVVKAACLCMARTFAYFREVGSGIIDDDKKPSNDFKKRHRFPLFHDATARSLTPFLYISPAAYSVDVRQSRRNVLILVNKNKEEEKKKTKSE